MPVAATGSGKTVVLSKAALRRTGASVAIAHRQELVSQISIALAVTAYAIGWSVPRRVELDTGHYGLQVAELGYSFFDPNAKTGSAGWIPSYAWTPTTRGLSKCGLACKTKRTTS